MSTHPPLLINMIKLRNGEAYKVNLTHYRWKQYWRITAITDNGNNYTIEMIRHKKPEDARTRVLNKSINIPKNRITELIALRSSYDG